jgi:DNA-binding transcriptional MerR regulator/quercetin dioxygenase-like cupin family protein
MTLPPPDDALPTARYAIGEVARLAQLSQAMIRRLEAEGLVQPQRSGGGHRLYTETDVERLRHASHLWRVEGLNLAAIRREIGALPPPPQTSAPDHQLGHNLRAARQAQQRSLADVAAQTGLSVSFLSDVERGQSRISLGNLFKLAFAYGTTVPQLNAGCTEPPRPLTRPGDRPSYVANGGRVRIEDLNMAKGALEAQWFEVSPGGESEEAYAHPGEELVVVVSGQLAFWLADQPFQLGLGEALHFQGTVSHRWRNDGEQTAIAIWINVPLADAAGLGSGGRHQAHRHLGSEHGTLPAMEASPHSVPPLDPVDSS